MLKKRIIPCLDIKNGRTVKGINFLELRDCGDPVELAKYYSDQGCDELVFLDIVATLENRNAFSELVKNISREINIPFTVGGGIRSIDDVSKMLDCGADKVSINSAALNNSKLVKNLSDNFGSQCIVVAIDIKKIGKEWYVFKNGGTFKTRWTALDWAKEVCQNGAGEILLTVMDNDGTQTGFALDISRRIDEELSISLIASGGAGCSKDFVDLFTKTDISAGLAASIFHFQEVSILELKSELLDYEIPTRIII